MEPVLDLSPAWSDALDRAAWASRTLVLGPTDSGKSSFIRALAARRPEFALVDLDPGQKMVGPPGSASLGSFAPEASLERFVFLGSTAVGGFHQLLEAGMSLIDSARARAVAVNTSGYVSGPGARLQLMTAQALRPDLVIAIGLPPPLLAALDRAFGACLLRLAPSPAARRKTEGQRRAIRQHAFAAALAGAGPLRLKLNRTVLEPGHPVPFSSDDRPVCSLADAAGEDMEIGLLREVEEDSMLLWARTPPRPVRRLRLGMMWASGDAGELRQSLAQAWVAPGCR